MIKLYEYPTKYAHICDTVEDIESDKLIKYDDNYYKYGGYYIKVSEVNNIKKRKPFRFSLVVQCLRL